MSVGFIRSNVARKVVSVVCLLTFPAVAQQANTGLQMQATPQQSGSAAQSGSQQPRAEPAAVDAAARRPVGVRQGAAARSAASQEPYRNPPT